MLPKQAAPGEAPQHDVYAVKKDAWDKVSFEVAQGRRSALLTEGMRPGRRLD
jgi:hypothetical protein